MKPLFSIAIVLLVFLFTQQTTVHSYTKQKEDLIFKRSALHQQYLSCSSDSMLFAAGKELHKSLTEKIIPVWYGTVWDFNGTSEIPRQGKIACGYFVSTTLRDAGFNLNRYKMAQAHSFDEVRLLCDQVYITQSIDSLKKQLRTSGDGLYILGLTNHIGFASVEKGTVYFIHSNYLSPSCVVKESLTNSAAVLSSSDFHLGNISTNKSLMKKWLENKVISSQYSVNRINE